MVDKAYFSKPNGRFVRTTTLAHGCEAFVPADLPPAIDWNDEFVALVSASDRALGELAGLATLFPNPHLLTAPFIRREAVLSSRIEGTQASVNDLYLFEVMPTQTQERADVREVHNYVEALEYGLERIKTLPFSRRLLCELHRILMDGVRGQERRRGEFRSQQNWIGPLGCSIERATFVPPPPAQMHTALDALERYLHAPSTLPPLVRAALVHYQFEAIHPFEDGNGRIGRLLIALMLCDSVLPSPLLYISDVLERNREAYYRLLLAVSAKSAWSEWITFFLRAATEAARDGLLRARRLRNLQMEMRSKVSKHRSKLLLPLVDLIFTSPAVTLRKVADELRVTPRSAQLAIEQLMREGILTEATGQKRNRVYVARHVVASISDRTLDQ